MKVEKKFLQTW